MKRFLALQARLVVLAVALAVSAVTPAHAAPRRASMAIDANTGTVLHNKSGHAPRYPASLTKMMTLYMTFELIELGRLSYTSKIKMTEEAASAPPSKFNLDPGEELTILDAIKALITKSANDVAVALAQHIAGSEQEFARLMTAKAHKLGMSATIFKNATGLPNSQQVTTARDMLSLAMRLQDEFPRHYKLFSTRRFPYRGKTYRNHNALLSRYRGTDGIKTGYTRASGFNLVASVRRDGKHVVAVVFGGRTAKERNATMRTILNRALAKASTRKTRKPALVASARPPPDPDRALRPVSRRTAPAAAKPPPPPPSPVVADAKPPANALPPRTTNARPSIMVAKVRPISIETHLRGPGAAPRDPTPPRADAAVANESAISRFAPPGGVLTTGASPASPLPQSKGQAPSTLQAQAGALARGAPARRAPTARPGVQPQGARPGRQVATGPQGQFEIQIGAYNAPSMAEQQIEAARRRAGGLLDGYRAAAIPVQKGPRQIYRARFQGFDATAAASACLNLRRLKIDCFVIRAR